MGILMTCIIHSFWETMSSSGSKEVRYSSLNKKTINENTQSSLATVLESSGLLNPVRVASEFKSDRCSYDRVCILHKRVLVGTTDYPGIGRMNLQRTQHAHELTRHSRWEQKTLHHAHEASRGGLVEWVQVDPIMWWDQKTLGTHCIKRLRYDIFAIVFGSMIFGIRGGDPKF